MSSPFSLLLNVVVGGAGSLLGIGSHVGEVFCNHLISKFAKQLLDKDNDRSNNLEAKVRNTMVRLKEKKDTNITQDRIIKALELVTVRKLGKTGAVATSVQPGEVEDVQDGTAAAGNFVKEAGAVSRVELHRIYDIVINAIGNFIEHADADTVDKAIKELQEGVKRWEDLMAEMKLI